MYVAKIKVIGDWLSNQVYIDHTWYKNLDIIDEQSIALSITVIEELIERLQQEKAKIDQLTHEYIHDSRNQVNMP